MIDDVTSQEVAIVEAQPTQLTFVQQYPGSPAPSTPVEMLRFVRVASRYTGGVSDNAEKYCSTTLANGHQIKQYIHLWGVLAYQKELVDRTTGEVRKVVGVVFRLGDEQGPSERYLSFSSVAAWNFVKRSLLPLIECNMIKMGDWTVGLPVLIRKKTLEVGHTYTFELVEEDDLAA